MNALRSMSLALLAVYAAACGSSAASDDSSSDAAGGTDGTSGSDGSSGADGGSSNDGSGGDGGSLVDGSGGDSAATDASADSAGDAGTDGDASSFCPVPCDPTTSFCEGSYGPPNPDGGGAETFFCTPFESPCDAGAPACACATVGPFCTCIDDAGAVEVTCPFHP